MTTHEDEIVQARTEADAVADRTAAPVAVPVHDSLAVITTPPGWATQRTALESLEPAPYRPRGTTSVQDGDSFAQAVLDQRLDSGDVAETTASVGGPYEPRVYAQEKEHKVTAILNQSQGTTTGWGDLRVELRLQRTTEWEAWKAFEGLHGQGDFAEFIEEHLEELAGPDEANPGLLTDAELLELAQSFQATIDANFKRAEHLQSGQVAVTYEEQIEATAGKSGQLRIPDEIHLLIRPFVGSDIYRVKARFRYRVNGGNLKVGFKLIRADDVERTVFTDQTERIESLLQLPIIRGSVAPVPPSP